MPKLSEIKVRRIYLFKPGKQSLISSFPELRKVPEFVALSDIELKYVWWLSNPTSPFVANGESMDVRKEKAFLKTFDSSDHPDRDDIKAGVIPKRILDAVPVMKSYSVEARFKQRVLDEMVLDEYERIIANGVGKYFDIDSGQFREANWSEIEKYQKVCSNIRSEYPDLLKRIETGYGLAISEEEESLSSIGNSPYITSLEDFHEKTSRKD